MFHPPIRPYSVKNTVKANDRAVLSRVQLNEVINIEDQYIGKIYGCYKIISRTGERANDGHIIYNCECIHCGAIKQMQLSSIKYSNNTKCTHYITFGDIVIPNALENDTIPNRRLRKIYLHILRRCYEPNNKDYNIYGGKGIKVCAEWLNNPNSFYQWSILNGYDKELTIDRIDENKGYAPDNCRWVSREENARFKSNTNYITAKVTLSGKQWATLISEHGANYINTMLRKQGKEKTIKYLEERLANKHDLINT